MKASISAATQNSKLEAWSLAWPDEPVGTVGVGVEVVVVKLVA
jgi:hypothetical protein